MEKFHSFHLRCSSCQTSRSDRSIPSGNDMAGSVRTQKTIAKFHAQSSENFPRKCKTFQGNRPPAGALRNQDSIKTGNPIELLI